MQSNYAKLLSNNNFRVLWFGQICSQLAVNTLLFVLALRIYQTTASNTAVSGLFIAFGVPSVLFGMIAGTAVDRLDKRRVLVFCDALRAIVTLGLLFTSHQVVVVYIFTLLNAIITQFYIPSEAPLIPKIVPKDLLVSANSLFSMTFYSSLAVGTMLSGPLLRWFGPYGIFIFLSSLFAVASMFSSRIPSQSSGTIGIRYLLLLNPMYIVKKIWTDLAEGVRYITQAPALFDAIMLLTGTQIIFALLGTLGPGFADRVLAIDIRDSSLYIVGPAVLGILCGVLWVGSKGYKFRRETLIQSGITGAGIVLVLIALIARLMRVPFMIRAHFGSYVFPLEVFLFFLLGVSNSLLDVPANTNLQEKAQGSMRGRVYGMLTAFVGGVGVLPVILGGFLADTIGVGKVIFCLGVGIVLYAAYRVRYSHAIGN